jgi:hypothetical protein
MNFNREISNIAHDIDQLRDRLRWTIRRCQHDDVQGKAEINILFNLIAAKQGQIDALQHVVDTIGAITETRRRLDRETRVKMAYLERNPEALTADELRDEIDLNNELSTGLQYRLWALEDNK